jgi:hypothetical protein
MPADDQLTVPSIRLVRHSGGIYAEYECVVSDTSSVWHRWSEWCAFAQRLEGCVPPALPALSRI